jgi:hypothetical protein
VFGGDNVRCVHHDEPTEATTADKQANGKLGYD